MSENDNSTPSQQEIPEDLLAILSKANEIRLNLPEEQTNPWLTFLLDAYSIIDGSVIYAEQQAEKNKRKLACVEGCAHCCYQEISISPLETMGIRLAIQNLYPKIEREKIEQELIRMQKKENLDIEEKQKCPFLIDNSCSIYAFRPITCRRILMLDTPCTNSQEVIVETRTSDLLHTDQGAFYAAYLHTAQVYEKLGISSESEPFSLDNFANFFVDIRSIEWLK